MYSCRINRITVKDVIFLRLPPSFTLQVISWDKYQPDRWLLLTDGTESCGGNIGRDPWNGPARQNREIGRPHLLGRQNSRNIYCDLIPILHVYRQANQQLYSQIPKAESISAASDPAMSQTVEGSPRVLKLLDELHTEQQEKYNFWIILYYN